MPDFTGRVHQSNQEPVVETRMKLNVRRQHVCFVERVSANETRLYMVNGDRLLVDEHYDKVCDMLGWRNAPPVSA